MISEFIFFPGLFGFLLTALALTFWIVKRWCARTLPECIQCHLPEYREVFPSPMTASTARVAVDVILEWGGAMVGTMTFVDLLFAVWGVPADLVG